MSRLIEKFQKAAKSSPQPMGFRTSRSNTPEPSILLIVSGTPEEITSTANINKADAALIRLDNTPITPDSLKKITDNLKDIPAGCYINDDEKPETEALSEAGCDFMVFPPSGRYTAPADEKKTSYILQVESSMDDSLLRAVNSLPVEAVLAADTFTGGALSWHELMIFQHLANSFIKPLIVNIPEGITEAELKALWECGADGVIAEAATLEADGMKKLLELISKLPPRSARKKGKTEVSLPRPGGPAEIESPDEEDDE